MTWWAVDDNTTIKTLQKCASLSMRAVFESHYIKQVPVDLVGAFERRVVFVRDPIERLISAYSHASDMAERGIFGDIVPQGIIVKGGWEQEDWVRFVDYVLENREGNTHFDPQYDQLLYCGELLPNIIHPFDDLLDEWPKYWSGRLPLINPSNHRPVGLYREMGLDLKYMNDQRLWEEAWR